MGSSSFAQETNLKPLREILAIDFEDSYIPLRCGGLFMSMARFAGKDALGVEAYDGLLVNADNLLKISSSFRATDGENEQDTYQQILKEAVLIAKLYIDRFQENYIKNGSAWQSDPEFLDDLSICRELQDGK